MSRHRSFRLSREAYLIDRRVKLRLRIVHGAICLFRLLLIVVGIALFWFTLVRVPEIQPKGSLRFIGAVGHLFIALVLSKVGFWWGRRLALRFGWMSDSESTCYHDQLERWPESWLEPRPGSSRKHPLDREETATDESGRGHSLDHTAARILKARLRTTVPAQSEHA
ncbi:MAG: hypothetical protein AAGI63_18900 [Planctomycetota bacterium]